MVPDTVNKQEDSGVKTAVQKWSKNTFPERTYILENLLPFFVSQSKRPQKPAVRWLQCPPVVRCASGPAASPGLCSTCGLSSACFPHKRPLVCCPLQVWPQAGGYPSASRCLNSWNFPLKNASNNYLFCTYLFSDRLISDVVSLADFTQPSAIPHLKVSNLHMLIVLKVHVCYTNHPWKQTNL